MLPKTFCFLDTETTGMNASFNRIIEIGIIRVENNKIVRKLNTLINPDTGIPSFISNLTGITSQDLENAPSFYEVSQEVLDILKDSIMVAHSARFDYGFLKNEFRRLEIPFSTKHICSVKLARTLFPGLDYYNLDAIMSHFNIKCENRHRAYDDARVIFDFFQKIQESVSEKIIAAAIDKALKKPSLPINLTPEALDKLPEAPGVYIFYGEDKYPIYIGKSVNIRDRVLSHFTNDHSSLKDMQISQEVRDIETITTAGELGALLLESTLVKKYQPLYNSMLREARKMILLIQTEDPDGYYSVDYKEVEKIDPHDTDKIIGIFKSFKQMRNHLYELSKQFSLCPKRLGLDHSKKTCFYYHLKQCYGACVGRELNIKYNMRFTQAFYKYKLKRWVFDSAVIIKEKGDREEAFIIDKWCLLGSVKSEDDMTNITNEYRFDLDTYKILTKFLLKPTSSISVNQFKLPQ